MATATTPLKKGQIELEFIWGEYVAPLSFIVVSIAATIICGIISHWSNTYTYVFYFCPCAMYVFAFALSSGVNLMPRMREPSMTNYHLLFLSFGLGIFSFAGLEFVFNKFGPSVLTPALHQLFFGLVIFITCIDEFLCAGGMCPCLKNKIGKFILSLMLAIALAVAFYLFVLGASFEEPIKITVGLLPSYISWLAFAGFVVYYSMRDVFAESPFLVRMGGIGRGFCYFFMVFFFPILPIAIIFGATFLIDFSMDVMPLEQRLSMAFIPSLFGYSAVVLMQKYSDNFTADHPVQPVDLNQGKKGGRKGLSKNQKPSESGTRCCKRLSVILGAIIAGYFAAHWVVGGPLHIAGYLLDGDLPPNTLTMLTESKWQPLLDDLLLEPPFSSINTSQKWNAFAKHNLSPAYNEILWGGQENRGGEAGIAMVVAILLFAHGVYTMAYGLQVPKSGQTIGKNERYEEEIEPMDGDEEMDEEAKEEAKAAAEEKEKQERKQLKVSSGYGRVGKK